MKRLIAISTVLCISFLCIAATDSPRSSFVPKDGFVPDEKTAVAIAVAVWSPIFGADQIEKEKPFKARLEDGAWHVEGYLPPGYIGGVAHAVIAKKDGKILSVWHDQ